MDIQCIHVYLLIILQVGRRVYYRCMFLCVIFSCITICLMLYASRDTTSWYRDFNDEVIEHVYDGQKWHYTGRRVTKQLYKGGMQKEMINNKQVLRDEVTIDISAYIKSGHIHVYNDNNCQYQTKIAEWRICDYEQKHFLQSLVCRELNIAVMPTTDSDIRDTMELIRALVFVKSNKIRLHIFTNNLGVYVFSHIFATWDIIGFEWQCYEAFQLANDPSILDKRNFALVSLHKSLHHQVQYLMVVLDLNVRFLDNMHNFWSSFMKTDKIFISFPNSTNITTNYKDVHIVHRVIMININRILELSNGLDLTVSYINESLTHSLINSRILYIDYGTVICYLDKDNAVNAVTICQAIVGKNLSKFPETLKVALNMSILPTTVTHRIDTSCYIHVQNNPVKSVDSDTADNCKTFRNVATLSYVTHRYFIDHGQYGHFGNRDPARFSNRVGTSASKFHTTMATVFTMSRFSFFERLVSMWGGPVSAVFYGYPREIDTLYTKLFHSKLLKGILKQVTIHAVYKHGNHTPINYLRNVAINESLTNFTFYNDVDLLTIPNLYQKLENKVVPKKDQHQQGSALVIPAFEAFIELDSEHFPKNKVDIIKLMSSNVPAVSGYRELHGWRLGHHQTNYKKWRHTKDPYFVAFYEKWEPYMVLPTSMMPRYDQRFSERMLDKIHYTLAVYFTGLRFLVLDDVFIIHQPHISSDSWRKLNTDTVLMSHCAQKQYLEYAADLQRWQNNVTVPCSIYGLLTNKRTKKHYKQARENMLCI